MELSEKLFFVLCFIVSLFGVFLLFALGIGAIGWLLGWW